MEEECEESDEGEEDRGEADPEDVMQRGGSRLLLPDDEEIQRREEHYQRLRREIGVGEASNGTEAPDFSSDALDRVQALWDPLTAGELLARVGHFIRGGPYC